MKQNRAFDRGSGRPHIKLAIIGSCEGLLGGDRKCGAFGVVQGGDRVCLPGALEVFLLL